MYKKIPSRLEVMMHIHHSDEYYQNGLASKGIDYRALTHEQIAVWIATVKAIEADILIETACVAPLHEGIDTIDVSFVNNVSENSSATNCTK